MAKQKPKATKADKPTVKGAETAPIEPAKPRAAWSERLGERICKKIAEGATLTEVTELRGYPAKQTIAKWVVKHPQFGANLASARLLQGDYFKDEVHRIARGSLDGSIDFRAARVAADQYKWLASVTNPAYADKGKQTNVQVNVNNEVSRDRVSKLGKGKRLEAEALYSSLVDGDKPE